MRGGVPNRAVARNVRERPRRAEGDCEMYQRIIVRQTRIAALLAAVALAFGATIAGAQDIPGCQAAVVKGAQKYASTRVKALQKCEEGRLTGKITTTCATDAKTQDKITKASDKLQADIAKK